MNRDDDDGPAYGLHTCTVVKLLPNRIDAFSLRRGDTLRAEVGVVWGTLADRVDDVLVTPDRPFVLPVDGEVRLSALSEPAVASIVTRRATAALPLPRGSLQSPRALLRRIGAAPGTGPLAA